MTVSPRLYFAAGALFLAGSLAAGLVQCREDAARDAAQEARKAAWQTQLSSPALPAGKATPAPAAVPADARCAVCGMYPARFPRWAAQLVLRDGSARWFESAREMLVFQQDIDRYGKGVQTADLVAGFVSDFDGGGWVNATQAFFVRGSRQRGPMGADAFPAFGKRTAATAFATAQGGEVLTYPALVEAFAGEKNVAGDAHRHHVP